jgi:uncharacterized protein
MANAVNWFEIPVTDIARATRFYSTIFGQEFKIEEATPGFQMAQLAYEDGVGGALVQGDGYVPSAHGTLVYLNGGEDLSTVLDRVEAAGGQVLTPKMDIGEHGFAAFFVDSEGNKIGLHSLA